MDVPEKNVRARAMFLGRIGDHLKTDDEKAEVIRIQRALITLDASKANPAEGWNQPFCEDDTIVLDPPA